MEFVVSGKWMKVVFGRTQISHSQYRRTGQRWLTQRLEWERTLPTVDIPYPQFPSDQQIGHPRLQLDWMVVKCNTSSWRTPIEGHKKKKPSGGPGIYWKHDVSIQPDNHLKSLKLPAWGLYTALKCPFCLWIPHSRSLALNFSRSMQWAPDTYPIFILIVLQARPAGWFPEFSQFSVPPGTSHLALVIGQTKMSRLTSGLTCHDCILNEDFQDRYVLHRSD